MFLIVVVILIFSFSLHITLSFVSIVYHNGRTIGLDAAFLGLTFLKEIAQVSCVVDPFCGVGTVCAMANAMGMKSVGKLIGGESR